MMNNKTKEKLIYDLTMIYAQNCNLLKDLNNISGAINSIARASKEIEKSVNQNEWGFTDK